MDTLAKILDLLAKYVAPVVSLIQQIRADVKGDDTNAQTESK